MNKRTAEKLNENQTRNEAFIERRQAAEARKILRKELKNAKVNPLEKWKIVHNFPPDKLQRIGRAHFLETAAQNALSDARGALETSKGSEIELVEQAAKFSTNSRKAMEQSSKLLNTADKVENEDLPATAVKLTEATKALEELTQNRQLPEDDPSRLSDVDYRNKFTEAERLRDEAIVTQAMLSLKLKGMRLLQGQRRKRAIQLRAKALQTHGMIDAKRRDTAEAARKAAMEKATLDARSESLERVIDRSIT